VFAPALLVVITGMYATTLAGKRRRYRSKLPFMGTTYTG